MLLEWVWLISEQFFSRRVSCWVLGEYRSIQQISACDGNLLRLCFLRFNLQVRSRENGNFCFCNAVILNSVGVTLDQFRAVFAIKETVSPASKRSVTDHLGADTGAQGNNDVEPRHGPRRFSCDIISFRKGEDSTWQWPGGGWLEARICDIDTYVLLSLSVYINAHVYLYTDIHTL